MVVVKIYESLAVLFDRMADQISAQLKSNLRQGDTALVVSGGTTPKPLFERLSEVDLAWDKVTIIPSDERWLASDHEASNEHLILTSLQQNKAAKATVQGLKLDVETAAAAEQTLNQQLADKLAKYSVAIVGMGLDGHFASIFPGTAAMADALRIDGEQLCYAVDATGCDVAGEYTERMTLSLSAILNADHVFLLITGEEKQQLVHQAINGEEEVADLPISKLLQQDSTTVTVCCA